MLKSKAPIPPTAAPAPKGVKGPSSTKEPEKKEAVSFSPKKKGSGALTRDVETAVHSVEVETILGRIKRSYYRLNPSYQRAGGVWTSTQQRRFIESLFLGIPIPPVFLVKQDDASYDVVDGLQRLTALRRFLEGALMLDNLDLKPELNGFTFEQLPDDAKSVLLSATIPFYNIKPASEGSLADPTTLARVVFDRVNSGTPLRPGERIHSRIIPGSVVHRVLSLCIEELKGENGIVTSGGSFRSREYSIAFYLLYGVLAKRTAVVATHIANDPKTRYGILQDVDIGGVSSASASFDSHLEVGVEAYLAGLPALDVDELCSEIQYVAQRMRLAFGRHFGRRSWAPNEPSSRGSSVALFLQAYISKHAFLSSVGQRAWKDVVEGFPASGEWGWTRKPINQMLDLIDKVINDSLNPAEIRKAATP